MPGKYGRGSGQSLRSSHECPLIPSTVGRRRSPALPWASSPAPSCPSPTSSREGPCPSNQLHPSRSSPVPDLAHGPLLDPDLPPLQASLSPSPPTLRSSALVVVSAFGVLQVLSHWHPVSI